MTGKQSLISFLVLASFTLLAACGEQAATPPAGLEAAQGNSESSSMVLVPGGEFISGNPRWISAATPGEATQVEAFYIDRSEVTNTQFAACVQDGACPLPLNTDYFEQADYADHPVVFITRAMAASYCEWRQARLPTALEWEKAAINDPARSQYPLDDFKPTCQAGAIPGAGYSDEAVWEAPVTEPVGSSNQNQLGIFDVAGNTLEWAQPDSPETQAEGAGASVSFLRTIRYSGYGELYGRYYCSFRCAQTP